MKYCYYNLEKQTIEINTSSRLDIALIKTLPSISFDYKKNIWIVPYTKNIRDSLIKFGFKIENLVDDSINVSIYKKLSYSDRILPNLEQFKKFFPYQLDGVKFFEELNGRALLSDDQGTGKTIQTIGYILLHPEMIPILIVCPSSVKYNWKKEIIKWTDLKDRQIHIINGKSDIYKNKRIYIINWDILQYHSEYIIKNIKPDLIITDETHYINNVNTNRFRSLKKISKVSDKIIALTGTPIQNHTIDIFSILHILQPKIWSSRWKFAEKYCDLKFKNGKWDMNGSSNLDELHNILKSTIMLRRKKSEVLKDLPPKIRTILPLEYSDEEFLKYKSLFKQLNFVDNINEEVLDDFNSKVALGFLAECEKLKQQVWSYKKYYIIVWIRDFLRSSNEKLVIFAHHKNVISFIMKSFPNMSVKIDGSVNSKDRQDVIDKFENDNSIRIFVGNLRAASEGINLQFASSTELILELPWRPGILDQAEDRVFRIGQSKFVNIYYPIVEGTIEEDLMNLIDKKTKTISSIIDGDSTINDVNLLKSLYLLYKKRIKDVI